MADSHSTQQSQRTEPSILSDDALNVALAEAMGIVWDESRCRVCGWPLDRIEQIFCRPGDCAQRPVPSRRADSPPDYCSDHTAAASVRAEIARRGLGPQFARALSGIVKPFGDDLDVQSISGPKAPTLWIPAWKMVNASPRDTALAALLTVHAEPTNG